VGLRVLDLGYSNIHDYAREELGINASTAAKMERLARRLADLPVIRDALRRGFITPRKAEIIAPVARGNEAYWLFRGQAGTVRDLKAEVKGPRDPDEEQWVKLCTQMPPAKRKVIDLALGLAGMVLERPTASNALERGLERHPLLRQALAERRLSYEQARLIARDATPGDVPAWIDRAQHLTCIELRRKLQEKAEAQMCARGQFNVWMPEHVANLLKGCRDLIVAGKRPPLDMAAPSPINAAHPGLYQNSQWLLTGNSGA
ncbi:MAG TPA: hypothetical protein VEP66_20110, partial [Myxococcales bacterium]|nr:hypothetical protein [Myxococcales bacterium]